MDDRGVRGRAGPDTSWAATSPRVDRRATRRPRRPLRVLVVDQYEVVRRGLRAVLGEWDDLEVVGEASAVADAVRAARELAPDVVVLDARLRDGSGALACRGILGSCPDAAVLVLTDHTDDSSLFDTIMAGAAGFLPKRVRGQEIVAAVRRVGAGESILDPSVTTRVLDRVRSPAQGEDPLLARLTPTEVRILGHIAEGMTNREIGAQVDLAPKTVKNYVSSILAKLEVARRAEAAAYLADRRARQRLAG